MKTSIPVSAAHCHLQWSIVSLLLPLCFFALLQPAHALEKGEYPAPALDQFQPADESGADVDGDGVNESLIKRYTNEAGESLFSFTTGDRVWAWSFAIVVGDQLDPTKSYLIRDNNCDGVFDEKYRTDEDFQIPACLK